MPLQPNLLERLLFLRFDRGPAPVFDLFGAASFEAVTLAIDAVTLAIDAGLFDVLAVEPQSSEEQATRLDDDERGLEVLLEFLVAQGYVTETEGRYRNTSMTATWLTSDSETNVAPWLTFWDELVFPFWEQHLETAVVEGEPPRTIYEWFDEEPSRWETAQAGFRAAAALTVDEVARAVDVPAGASSLIDVGGGHGLYAVALCRAHPELTATVFDNPEALDAARREISAAGLDERVGVAGGDYWTDDFGTDYDVALLCNVVHAHDAAANRRLFGRVAECLRPGGRIAVLDQLEGSTNRPVGRSMLGFVGLTYLATLGAEIHPYEAVADWLRDAGFESVTRDPVRAAGPGNTLVQATKPVG